MNDTFCLSVLRSDLTTDEGYSALPYQDTAIPPNITIGVGRNLTIVGVSTDEVTLMLNNDIMRAASSLDQDYPWWRTLPQGAQRVMLNLVFNMGAKTFSTFVNFLEMMRTRNWSGAIRELKSSKWYTEVGERGPRMCTRLAVL